MKIPNARLAIATLAGLLAAAAPLVPGATGATGTRHHSSAMIKVTPTSGSPRSTFAVRFRAPSRTGNVATGVTRSLNVLANGPTAAGCVGNIDVAVDSPAAGARLTAWLDPGRGARWCKGAYRGTIEEIDGTPCPVNQVCVGTNDRVRVTGRFRFRVR